MKKKYELDLNSCLDELEALDYTISESSKMKIVRKFKPKSNKNKRSKRGGKEMGE